MSAPLKPNREHNGEHARVNGRAAEDDTVQLPAPTSFWAAPVPCYEKAVTVRGMTLPAVMVRGTTISSVERGMLYTGDMEKGDVDFLAPGLGVADASTGDPRAWPKNKIDDRDRAVIVFSTDLAFSEELGDPDSRLSVLRVDAGSDSVYGHIRFSKLPKGSYKVIRGDRVDMSGYPLSMTQQLKDALEGAKTELFQRAVDARAKLGK